MTFIDTLTDAARNEINSEIDYVQGEIIKVVKKLNTKATIALGESLHDKVTDAYAPMIADAMRQGVSNADLLAAIASAKKKWQSAKKATQDEDKKTSTPEGAIASGGPTEGPIPADLTSEAIASNVNFSATAITGVLQDLCGDGGVLGADVAAQHIGTTAGSDFTPLLIDGIDWHTWHPGDLRSAQLIANGGLKELLDDADTTINGMSDSMLERMGNVMADGLNQGLAPQTIADNMKELGLSDERALLISRTETARAMTASSVDTYTENGTEEIQWHHNLNACPICVALDEGSPYPIDDIPPYPAHPNERCQLLPYFADL